MKRARCGRAWLGARWILFLLIAGIVQAQQDPNQAPEGFKPTARLGGYVTFFYTHSNLEDGSGEFENQEVELLISGDLTRKFEYLAELEFEEGGEEIKIEIASLTYKPLLNHNLVVGIFQVPFGLQNERHRPYNNRLTSRPLAMREVTPVVWSEAGVSARGYFDVGTGAQVRYAAWVCNGLAEAESIRSGRTLENENGRLGYGARLEMVPFSGVEFGASVYHGNYSADGDESLLLLGGHTKIGLGRLELEGEYVKARLDVPDGFETPEIYGFYGQGGFFLTKKVMAVYRLDRLHYLDDYHGPGFVPGEAGSGLDTNAMVHNFGLNFSPVRHVVLKGEFRLWDHENEALEAERQFIAEATFHF